MHKKDKKRLFFIGILLLIISFVDIIHTIFFGPLYNLFWFSNTINVLLGLALVIGKRLFMSAVLISSAAEIPWVIDFLGQLFLKKSLFGDVTEYMFTDFGYSSLNFYMELNHLLVIPIAIYGASKIGIHKNSYLISSTHIIVLNILTYYFTLPSKNINCVYHLCLLKEDIFHVNDILYLIIWTFSLCILAYLLNKIAIKFFKHQNSTYVS